MSFQVEINQIALTKKNKLSEKWIRKVVTLVTDYLKYKEGSVSIAFVTKPKIHEANRIYRGKDKPTDVLSFVYEKREHSGKNDLYWGEVIISPVMARLNISEFGLPYKKEIARLLIHGMLHLAGFDHVKPKESKIMFGIADSLLKKV